jgi:hypothetical protein
LLKAGGSFLARAPREQVSGDHAFGCNVVVILVAFLVARDEAGELVGEVIDSRVKVGLGTFGKEVAAFDAHGAFGALSSFFFSDVVVHAQEHFHVDHLIEILRHPEQFGFHILMHGRRNFQVMATDRQIHKDSFSWWKGCSFSAVGLEPKRQAEEPPENHYAPEGQQLQSCAATKCKEKKA